MSEYTFAEIKKAFEQRDKIFENARMRRNEALTALQEACTHATIVGGNEEWQDVDWRVCVTCGLVEFRGYNDDGDEYRYATRAYFKKMPTPKGRQQGTRAYKPEGDELARFGKSTI